MKRIFLNKILLTNYRNLDNWFSELSPEINIIIGSNGVGKTNILESISLLSPGKGLKSAQFFDICNESNENWASNFILASKLGRANIEVAFNALNKKRTIFYNGSAISSSELTNLLNIVWITPQMEWIFLSTASVRRKFIDRIVYNFDFSHAKRIAKYDHLLKERLKLLKDRDISSLSNDRWLARLESEIAQEALYIDNSRKKVIENIQNSINNIQSEFPKSIISLSKLTEEKNNIDLDLYINHLVSNRKYDKISGRTNFGVHRSDLLVFHPKNNLEAKLCSTGEQKALLISIILGTIESIMQNTKYTPIILLDELFVHLDENRKNYLSEYIISTKLQTFITDTNISNISRLSKHSNMIRL